MNDSKKGFVYLLPKNKLLATSYLYAPDAIFLHAHLCDKYARVRVRSSEPFYMAPMIFQQQLDIINNETRFSICKPNDFFQVRCWLQGTKVVDNSINLTPNKRTFSNIHSGTFQVCWGSNTINFKTMRGMVDMYFNSGFNGDLTDPLASRDNCESTREECLNNSYSPSDLKLISKNNADSLYLVHLLDKPVLYFWLKTAGFKPIEENVNIMIIPLKSANISHENKEYAGFLTPPDKCRKKWFITNDGHLISQLDSTVTVL